MKPIVDVSSDGYEEACVEYAQEFLRSDGVFIKRIENSPWVSFEDKALLVLQYTGNANAYFEIEGTIPASKFYDFSSLVRELAAYAMARDVMSFVEGHRKSLAVQEAIKKSEGI